MGQPESRGELKSRQQFSACRPRRAMSSRRTASRPSKHQRARPTPASPQRPGAICSHTEAVPRPYRQRPDRCPAGDLSDSADCFAWSRGRCLGTHHQLVAGSSPARPTRFRVRPRLMLDISSAGDAWQCFG